jgi:REP element-mobilizing transposase RayT
MARLLRVEYKGAIYHVTVRSNSGGKLYRDDKDREYWLYRLSESAEMHGVKMHLYCMMHNHFHLVVETPRGNLGRFMHSLLTGYTIFFNRRHRTHGHVTQGRYGARLVSGDDYLLKLGRYVHLNPVKVKAVRKLALTDRIKLLREYRWSSFPAYVGRQKQPEWLSVEPMIALVGGGAADRQKRYENYVEAGVAEDDAEFQSELKRSARSIGDADFREDVDRRYAEVLHKTQRPEDAALRQTSTYSVTPEAVLNAVATAAGVTAEELVRRRRESPLKAITASLLVRYTGLTQRDIAPLLGLSSGSSVSCQIRLLSELVRNGGGIEQLMAKAERLIRQEQGKQTVSRSSKG